MEVCCKKCLLNATTDFAISHRTRNYALRYIGQRGTLLKTLRKKSAASSFGFFLYILLFIFIHCNAIKLDGIFIRDYGIVIGISHDPMIFLGFFFHTIKVKPFRGKAEKRNFREASDQRDSSRFVVRNEVRAMRREICNWIRLYLH